MTQRRYGPLDRAQIAGMSGREVIGGIVAGRLPQPPICQTLSFWLSEAGEGWVIFEGDPSAALLNPVGTVHGGWALTLIDSVTGCAGHTTLEPDVSYTTLETKANFSKAITPNSGRVRAEGRVVTRGRQVMTAEGRILDTQGRLLAHGTSTLLILAPR